MPKLWDEVMHEELDELGPWLSTLLVSSLLSFVAVLVGGVCYIL